MRKTNCNWWHTKYPLLCMIHKNRFSSKKFSAKNYSKRPTRHHRWVKIFLTCLQTNSTRLGRAEECYVETCSVVTVTYQKQIDLLGSFSLCNSTLFPSKAIYQKWQVSIYCPLVSFIWSRSLNAFSGEWGWGSGGGGVVVHRLKAFYGEW